MVSQKEINKNFPMQIDGFINMFISNNVKKVGSVWLGYEELGAQQGFKDFSLHFDLEEFIITSRPYRGVMLVSMHGKKSYGIICSKPTFKGR